MTRRFERRRAERLQPSDRGRDARGTRGQDALDTHGQDARATRGWDTRDTVGLLERML